MINLNIKDHNDVRGNKNELYSAINRMFRNSPVAITYPVKLIILSNTTNEYLIKKAIIAIMREYSYHHTYNNQDLIFEDFEVITAIDFSLKDDEIYLYYRKK